MKRSEIMSQKKVKSDADMVEKVLEYVQGISEVKAYKLTGKKAAELNKVIDINENANRSMELTLIPFMTAQTFTLKVIGTAMTVTSILLHLNGSMPLLTCILMIISSYIVYANLQTAGSYSALLRTVDVSVSKAQAILDTPQMDIDGADLRPEHYDITANNISFSYDQRRIIDGISLHIPEHTTTAIVGPSGGGKTTLTSLLSRFWDVDEGEVLLDGRNVRDYSMDALMRNFSFVFQNVYLFHDTIANNIRFGKPEAAMDEVVAAAKKACCHDFISLLPDGYDTVIGSAGIHLSGGEKQRISIARAILADPKILILDEATASVDTATERAIQQSLDELTKGRTTLSIAHRLSTLKNAHRLVVIDNGKLVEEGTQEELYEKRGIYYELNELQTKALALQGLE